ncbi:MAG: hypothetical protein ACREA7_06120 [Nitrosotalea sp.]
MQNRTPAQKIGVTDKKTKWLDLLELAVSTNRGETTKENNH